MNERKDERAQVYYLHVTQSKTVETKHRHYIYPESVKTAGGLCVNARGLMNKEKVANNIAININAVQFTFNRNEKITQSCKIVYRNKTYDIESKDPMDFRSIDMKVTAKEVNDTTKYGDDEYDEQV